MHSVFIRDIIIATLLSVITAFLFKEICLAYCMILPYLFLIIGIEEFMERIIRIIHNQRIIRKLRNRKVLPPASKQD